MAQSGIYSDTMLVKLYSGSYAGEYILEDSKVVYLSSRVEKSVSIALVDSGQNFTQDKNT